jgi:tRNA-splicing ligase RtcB
METKRIDDVRFEIAQDKSAGMTTTVRGYASEAMLSKMKNDRTLQQAVNATTLPGIVGSVMVMPDGHEGYGFPVGGVAAFDADSGIISPGAVGFDINCGIRVIKTNMTENDIRPRLGALMDSLFKNIPSGVGSKANLGLQRSDLDKVCEEGVGYVIDKGFGMAQDLQNIEEYGAIAGADMSAVSDKAKSRGGSGLGTLGAGNHFLEVQSVGGIFDEKIADAYGLYKGQIVIMVHTGSRGFGHQICSDYLMELAEYQRKNGISLVDRELSYAYVNSKEADRYIAAMKCAVNYAFTNRQVITSSIRKSFEDVFGKSSDALGMDVLYDVAHNIVKLEEHEFEGRTVKVNVHRKGATRAFARNRAEIVKKYRAVGQPVLIPGSMGTASYILAGSDGAMKETFGSTCHGSGRLMSRHQAIREIPASRTFNDLKEKNVEIRVKTRKLISEEAIWAYKDVDDVIDVVSRAGLCKKVSRNIPIGVAKG